MEDALIEFVTTGKLNFKDLAGSIIKDMIRIEIQRSLSPILSGLGKAAISIIGNAFGGGGGGAVDPSSYAAGNEYAAAVANGGVFSNGNLTAFAKGGVVGGPTTFPMAQGGIGLMGEAGPEAVMPLKRGSDGKLGIASSGGGSGDVAVSITINDNRTQTETKSGGSDASKAPKVAEMIKSVVHAKLIQEMRPGGLLA
jgi:lambda family phage tail tape measure protein